VDILYRDSKVFALAPNDRRSLGIGTSNTTCTATVAMVAQPQLPLLAAPAFMLPDLSPAGVRRGERGRLQRGQLPIWPKPPTTIFPLMSYYTTWRTPEMRKKESPRRSPSTAKFTAQLLSQKRHVPERARCYSTAGRGSLAWHNRTHTGERVHSCEVEGCGYTAVKRDDPMRHVRTHTGAHSWVLRTRLAMAFFCALPSRQLNQICYLR
jgi:hypothetical protein